MWRDKGKGHGMNWQACALASAFFAGLTAVLAKVGVSGVNSNLATAIRTIVILIFAWSIVAAQSVMAAPGTSQSLQPLSKRTLLFLILSGITTGLSWLFYFRALQLAPASYVTSVSGLDKLSLVFTLVLAVLFLGAKVNPLIVLGAGLMTVGAVLLTIARP